MKYFIDSLVLSLPKEKSIATIKVLFEKGSPEYNKLIYQEELRSATSKKKLRELYKENSYFKLVVDELKNNLPQLSLDQKVKDGIFAAIDKISGS